VDDVIAYAVWGEKEQRLVRGVIPGPLHLAERIAAGMRQRHPGEFTVVAISRWKPSPSEGEGFQGEQPDHATPRAYIDGVSR